METHKKKERQLTTKNLCALIKVCGENFVTELRFGDVQVLFSRKPLEEPTFITPEQAIAGQSKSEIEAREEKTLLAEEDEHSELLLTDPAKYERLMQQGDLEDGHSRVESAV